MKWLFLVSQVRTTNSRERVKVWRLTKKVGALLYRNSVYVLPYSKECLEDFQWLCQQIRDSKGDASTFVSECRDTAENKALVRLFEEGRTADYNSLIASSGALLERIRRIENRGGSSSLIRDIKKEHKSLLETFQETMRIDFFENPLAAKAKVGLD